MALRAYEALGRDPKSVHLPDFHLRLRRLCSSTLRFSRGRTRRTIHLGSCSAER